MLVMATRQTNTSMEAACFPFPLSQAPVTSANAVSAMAPTLHAVRLDPITPSASGTTLVSSASHAPVAGQASSLSTDIVALITQTVQAAFQAREQAAQTPISVGSIAIPASSTSLGSLTSSLLAAGTGFPSGQAASATPQGRPAPIVVPSFVSTFAMPIPALAASSAHSLSSVSLAAPISLNAAKFPVLFLALWRINCLLLAQDSRGFQQNWCLRSSPASMWICLSCWPLTSCVLILNLSSVWTVVLS